jgi:hypothetical protein
MDERHFRDNHQLARPNCQGKSLRRLRDLVRDL